MSGIVAAGSVSEFFLEIVGDAIKARKLEATDGAQTYLVSLLTDYAKPDERAEEPLERPLAFLLNEALHTVEAGTRFDKLRALGDGDKLVTEYFSPPREAAESNTMSVDWSARTAGPCVVREVAG